MKLPGVPFYPAHRSNYTAGRQGNKITTIAFHHTAALNNTLRYLWANPDRNGSSHFFTSDRGAEQYVDTNDTAWTNGNWQSNLTSVTIEVNGDWRFGYTNQATLDNTVKLVAELRRNIPTITGFVIHRNVSRTPTVCPGDLPVQDIWDAATRILSPPKPKKEPAVLRTDIEDKKVVLIRDANVWDMSFTKFSNAKAVTALPAGTVVDVAGIYDHPLGSKYYLSKYSWSKNLNNGINVADCTDYVEPEKPVEVPKETKPQDNPASDEANKTSAGASGELDPLPVDPGGKEIGEILKIVRWIRDFLLSIFKRGE